MLEILGLFLQAAAGHVLYLLLHLESGSFPRPLSPAREKEAFAALQKGGGEAVQARDLLIRHNLRLVAHVTKKYYAAAAAQDDLISIGTIGLIKAVDTFDPARASKFSSYASRCIENAILTKARFANRFSFLHSFDLVYPAAACRKRYKAGDVPLVVPCRMRYNTSTLIPSAVERRSAQAARERERKTPCMN